MLALTAETVAVASAAGPTGVAVSAGMAASTEDVVLQVRDVSLPLRLWRAGP